MQNYTVNVHLYILYTNTAIDYFEILLFTTHTSTYPVLNKVLLCEIYGSAHVGIRTRDLYIQIQRP